MAKLIVKLSKGLKEQFQEAAQVAGTTTGSVVEAMIRAYTLGVINIVSVEKGEIDLLLSGSPGLRKFLKGQDKTDREGRENG